MLQTRYENEHFDSLAESIHNSRSRNALISTDRPDSSHRVDLHVYLIPTSVWRNVQNLAQNEAMDDAISAGFVRVSPDMNLHDLRDSIGKLCGNETFFPHEFIFLRSVGRCLTRVKSKQEFELKVKNYRPPQTYAPEIYLLEGRHEDHMNIPSASPALSSASYLFGTRYQTYINGDEINSSPTKLLRHIPIVSEKNHLPTLKVVQRPTERDSRTNLTRSNSLVENSSKQDLFKVKQEQERLRQRQVELERIRRLAEGKKNREADRTRRQRNDEATRSIRRQGKTDLERHRREAAEKEKAAIKIQASFRGFQTRQQTRERQRNRLKIRSRSSSDKSQRAMTKFEKFSNSIDEDLSDCSQILSRSSSICSTSSRESLRSGAETKTIRTESTISSAKSCSTDQTKLSSDEFVPVQQSEQDFDEKTIRSATVTKIRPNDDFSLPSSTPDLDESPIALEQLENEIKRIRQLEEEKRKSKQVQERRKRDHGKKQSKQDPEAMRMRLQQLRSQSTDLEKLRDDVIKSLKTIHQRITIRRKEARDIWKKKYYHEKKKTPALEEQNQALKTELESIQRKILQTIDNESKYSVQSGYLKEFQVDNFILQLARVQHEIQSIHHQIDHAKLRLTTDIKLRRQAEQECQTLKYELNQAKMNLKHIKSRVEP